MIDPRTITFSQVQLNKARAFETRAANDLRAYLNLRNRYREVTLDRLAAIEAGEEDLS